jgi:hypothetical protein
MAHWGKFEIRNRLATLQVNQNLARHGKARQGEAWQGKARPGKAWPGKARQGKAWGPMVQSSSFTGR